jgi:biotin carboxyl carrier protein
VLVASMPGRVVKIAVVQGQQVTAHQPLVVLEAMKMEHVVEAPYPGVISDLGVTVGQQVRGGARLLTLGALYQHRVALAGPVE